MSGELPMNLVGAVVPNIPLCIMDAEAPLSKRYGLEEVFSQGRNFLVLALGLDAQGRVYLLIARGSNGQMGFIWLPSWKCTVGMAQHPAPPPPISLPKLIRPGIA